ncbi:MAG: GLUG motif-containing protein [Peptococcia bacterium]
MTDFRVNPIEKTAETTLSIHDPTGVLTGVIQVVLHDPKGNVQRWTYADYAEAQQGVIQPVATFAGLESGMTYSAYGTYTYLDANGQKQTELFGFKTFYVEEQFIYFYDLIKEEPKPEPDPEFTYIKPQISCAPFVADIYDLHSTLTIQERGSLVAGGIRFEVYRDERLIMRKTVAESGEFAIGPLPPATDYQVIGYITYLNEYKLKVEEKILEQTISTLSLEELAPMSLAFQNGEIFYDRIQLIELCFADDPIDSSRKVGFTTIPYVAKIAVRINNTAYGLKAAQISAMQNGSKIEYETPAVLRSNRVYQYAIVCSDRFGNELPLTEPAVGETHTCKAPPKANIRLTGNAVANTELTVDIENKDEVQTQNCRIALYDLNDNLIHTVRKTEGGEDSDAATHHALPEDGGKIAFTNLSTGEAYSAVVYADYDLDNEEGIQENMEIGRIRFTTLPISALGYAIFTTEITELTDSGATLGISLDKNRTNQSLQFLLDKVTVLITGPDGEEIQTISLTGEELARFVAGEGEPFQIQLENLSSATEYTLTILAEVEQGTEIHEIKTSNNMESFKTLKAEPEVIISSYFAVSNAIELYDVMINDPDGAIVSNVNVLVSDSYGRVVGMSILQANTLYETIVFPKLIENEMYTFTFVATEFNKGYDYTTYETLYQLKPVYQIINENKLAGEIGLQSLDEITGDEAHFQAKLRVQISDEKQLLLEEPRYTIKVFKEEEQVDALVYEIEPAGSEVDNIFTYQVVAMSEYRLELWVKVRDHEFKLDDTSFTTEQPIIGLASFQDFNKIKTNKSGKFIVLNDIDMTSGPILGWEDYFNGELDFQGYTLHNSKGTYLFSHLGKTGIIKNMVLDLTIPFTDPIRYRGFIVYVLQGRMENIMANVKGCTEYLHNDWGIFCRTNSATGVIENFVVNLECPVYVWTNYGSVVPYNSGLVRNGYVYGNDIILPDIEVDGGYSASIFGGIVGRNETAGQVENVFNLVNIRTGTLVTPSTNNFGMIVGVNNGRVKNTFTTGEVYFGGVNDLRYGPAVGSQGGMLQTGAYYISASSTYTNTYNGKVTKETLYDPLWHDAVLGHMFETEEPVLLGYYPQLKMPDCMPAQPYLPLPELDVANNVNLASVMVEEQYEDYAIARFTFNNPSCYTIKSVAVEYLDATIIEGSQVDKDELTRVLVRLDNPTKFYSSYNVLYFGYGVSASSPTTLRPYQKGERLVNAEFFKPIRTIEDWASIEDSLEQNYRLKEDLDFNNTPPQLIRIGENDANQFTGKLDGGIYDKNMKCIGMHTIRNLDLSIGLGGVITNLKGSVSNLRVERLILENPTDSYVGFVRHTQSGALVDNVHLSNVRLSGSSMVGGIAGQCNYANLQNCSVNGIIIKNATTTLTAGGLAGQGSYCMIKNCYVDGLNILIEKAKSGNGVGGIIGYIDNSEVENCYAVGSIETNVQNAGGIIGRAGSGNMIQKFWSDVDITTTVDYIAGIVGFYPGGESEIVPVNSLVLGDLYSSVSTAANVRRIMGNRTDMLNAYAWSGQRINGGIPYEADGVTLVSDGAEVLSGELLCDPQTYIKRILLGDSFDYGQVHNGVLPQLYDTNGELLPYQTEHKLDENPLISIKDVTATTVGNQHMIQVKLSHEAGLNIENVRFDYLNVNTQVVPESDVSTTLVCTVEGNPVRYLDSYQLNGITYNGGQVYKALAKVTFEQPFYIDIPDVATWQTVMAERKDNFENFRITGNLDFGNRADIIYNVNVNRIVGNLGAEGEYSVIRNIKIDFPETGQSFINTVNAGVSGLRFENISLTNKKSGGSYVGIIGNCLGNIDKVAFDNVSINGLSATRVGCIGYCMGSITDVSVENVTIKTTGEYAGGLVGQAYISILSKLSAQEIEVSGKNYVGSLAGYVYGDISHSIAENVTVTGTGNYAGGISGYANPIIGGDVITNEQLSVKNAYIKGVSYVGGILGGGQLRNNTDWSTLSLAENCTVIGTGCYVGGLMGKPGNRNRNGLVKNCRIFGGYEVGGVMGATAGSWEFYALDSTISTIYGSQYEELTQSPAPSPPNASHNKNIGGVSARINLGSGGINGSGAVNCIIGAEGADNVGGVYGYCASSTQTFFCLDSIVYGRNNIGGIVGYHRACAVYNCQSNADVIASGENAGGISGYMYINRDLDGANVPRLQGNYYVGNVSAGDYAGGIVGRTSAELYGDNSRLIVAANVTANGNNGSIIGNLAGGSFAYLRIYNNSVLNVEGAEGRKAAEIYAEESQSSAGMMLVSTAQLKTASTYTSLGSYFSTTYRNYTSLTHNYMPYLRYSNATMPYQEGKDETGAYNPINSYRGGIPIPMEPDAMQMMRPIMALTSQELPVPDFYAAGADKLNIEFGKVNKYTRFSVWANDTMLFAQPIGQRVYTINYDYATPLTVVVTDGLHSKDYVVDPEPLRRNVLTFNTDYYWITGLGVQSGKSGLLAGHFLHLFAGQGLTATGKLVDLAEGEVIKEKVEIGLCEEAQPLHSFTYEADYRIKTYKNFSEITHDGETVTRDLQLLVKNGRLAALDPLLPVVYDGVIVDTVGEAEYLTVLGTDGKLADLKEPIVLPKDFKNYNLVQMSHNLRSSSPYVLVRYQNGSVVAFNYLTGELLSVETVKSDLSLIEYAKEFLQSKMDSVLADLSDGYLEIVALEKKLTVLPYQDNLDNLNEEERMDGENAGGTADQGKEDEKNTEEEDTEEENAKEEIVDGEELEEGDRKEKDAPESSATAGETVANKIEGNNQVTQDQGTLEHAGNGHVPDDEKDRQNSAVSSLVKSDPLVHRYVAIFNPKTGQYLLYHEKSILEEPEESLTSVNEQLKLEPVMVNSQKNTKKTQPVLPEEKGILLLFLIAVSIVLLLYYLYQKKRCI